MKKRLANNISIIALIGNAMLVSASDELAIHIFKDSNAIEALTVILDGNTEKTSASNGLAYFDLDAGAHSIQLLDNGVAVHSLRFNSAKGQFTDINVALDSQIKPKVSIESYFKTESAVQTAKAEKGGIRGRITANGIPVAGASIRVAGASNKETDTDEYGLYEIELPRGFYQLDISHPDFGSQTIDNYRVISNVVKGSNFAISQNNSSIEEVVVVAKFNASAFQENERYATNVIDTIGVEQLARFGGSDVAASVVHVPSVTIQDGRFIFIRGLGGRYITTTLNGSTLPGTNPSKRTVPLDLFPSNIVEQLDIKKTFIASMPGESTGGNLVINTRSFPGEKTAKLSISMAYADGLTGDDAYVDAHDGDFDVIGWDDGTREEPAVVRAIAKALEFSDFYPDNVEQELGRTAALLLKDNWDLDEKTAKPNMSVNMNFGDVFYLERSESELGFFAAANYKNEWQKRDKGVTRTYGGLDASVIEDDFTFEQFSNNVDISGLLSLGLNIGDSTYQANTVISRVTEQKVRRSEGYDGDALKESIRWSIEWVERDFLSQQFTGQHFIGENENLSANWQFTISRATRNAPDRRDVRFDLSEGDGVYNLEVPNLVRRYDDLRDDNLDFSTDFDYLIGSTSDFESSLSFGLQLINRERDSDSVSYGFTGGQLAIDDNAQNLLVSDVLTTANISGDRDTGYTFQDKTLPSDSYEASMDLNSLYVSYDVLWKSEYQLVAGVRYEDYQQTTETFSLQGVQSAVESVLDDTVALPSLSINWFFSEDQQLRFAIAQTVSRPDFKETSNATFYDTEFDFRVRGNPGLQVSKVLNIDARWEKYWSDFESISIALFYKDLSDPIERVVLPASGTVSNSRTFQNASSAEVFGIEFDGRRDFPFNDALTKSMFVSLNASMIDSEVELQGSENRELQGQPEYTLNVIVGYDDIENGHEFTVLFNQNGKSIVDVGISGLPDIIEEPRLDMNVNYKYYFTDEIVLSAKISNLLNSEIEFSQGGNIFQGYEKGTEFKAGVDWNF